MMRVFLEHLLFGPLGLATAGVPVRIDGVDRLIFGRLTNLLSDGDGHRQAWDWKGASSLKPCFKHFNVLRKGSSLAERKPGFVEIDCCDSALFRSWAAAAVFKAADAVAAARARVDAGDMPRRALAELEMAVGLNHNSHGMLMSPRLRFD